MSSHGSLHSLTRALLCFADRLECTDPYIVNVSFYLQLICDVFISMDIRKTQGTVLFSFPVGDVFNRSEVLRLGLPYRSIIIRYDWSQHGQNGCFL